MLQRNQLVLASVLITVLGLGTSGAVASAPVSGQPRNSHALWVHHFDSPEAMMRSVDVAAVVKVGASRPGRVVRDESGEHETPFTLVELTVIRNFKGAPEGQTLLLERMGGIDSMGREIRLDYDGGDFAPGSTHLLFLKRQQGSAYYYQVNDQGRFEVLPDKTLRAVAHDDLNVAGLLDGRSTKEAVDVLESIARKARQPEQEQREQR